MDGIRTRVVPISIIVCTKDNVLCNCVVNWIFVTLTWLYLILFSVLFLSFTFCSLFHSILFVIICTVRSLHFDICSFHFTALIILFELLRIIQFLYVFVSIQIRLFMLTTMVSVTDFACHNIFDSRVSC